ncbi:ubiquitin C-terminal hydrolase Ubp14 [Elasticomyces elasticus]|nr:ubiquitin C-terminal hydrolase Ubp14 [Elasticomyces elasticus]
MASTCPHTTSASASLHPPRPSDSVYREDCTLCFDSIDDPHGLQVCLSCFNGGCASPDRAHGQLHASQAEHPLAVTIKRTRKPRAQSKSARGDSEPPEKISKLAIQAETEEERYDVQTSIRCFECGVTDLAATGVVGETVEGILRANTFAKQEEVKAWEQEMTACEHTLCLEQTAPRTIPSGSLSHCADCSLKENLWLCLTCGNLGCGRSQWGNPTAGSNHAINHTTSTAHPVAVKLGSLTADGNADIYCYACDEERVDPELVAHLKHWGVDIEGRVKTEKSMTEMNVEQNLTWEFRMTDEKGARLEPVVGGGLTGLRNLGNNCYLNSVLQAVFAFPEFGERYLRPLGGEGSAKGKPAEDLEIQLRKLADGLLSGRYSKPAQLDADQATENDVTWQAGLAPAMLKHLIGRGHAEFSTMRQQDSFELLLHLLKLITRSQASAKEKYGDVKDPVDAMRFVMEQRLQCLGCGKVKYRQDSMDNLSVAVPIKRVARPDTSDDSAAADGDGKVNGEKEKVENFEPVTLKHCLDLFTAPETVELTCSSCQSTAGFSKQTLFKTFPTILAVNARRFEVSGWVPTKRDVPVIVSDEGIDMEVYRSQGKREGEVELPEDEGVGGGSGSGWVANEEALGLLMGMGFPRVRCEKALKATGNSVEGVEGAAGWLFEHMEDADIDEPMQDEGVGAVGGGGSSGGSSGGAAGGGVVSEESIESLGNMGFAAPQARQALKETGGDMERAVDWLFSHPDAAGDFGGDDAQPTADTSSAVAGQEVMVEEDTRPAKFGLRAIVCHKGSSIHAGHYVAFVRKELEGGKEGWVLFNDEKVALGSDAEEMRKFAYIYFFRREGA